MNFKHSRYTLQVQNEVINGISDIVVAATAGSGKSTLIEHLVRNVIQDEALVVAFNTHIVKAMSERLASISDRVSVRTLHSVGNSCVNNFLGSTQRPDTMKYRKILSRVLVSDRIDSSLIAAVATLQEMEKEESTEAQKEILELADFCRLTLTNYKNISEVEKMIDEYSLDFEYNLELFFPLISYILDAGITIAKEEKLIDFTDMLWLCHIWNLKPWQSRFVLVDECQDLNKAQLELALKCRANGGRMIFVGDRNQAIMGFAGADCNSIDNIIARTNAIELPLSICYRCPKSHIALAQGVVSDIEAAEWAIDGNIANLLEDKVAATVSDNDLIIGRKTAPLVSLCISLISAGKNARVRGKEIGKGLVVLAKDVAKQRYFTFDKFLSFLDSYKNIKISKMKQNANETAIENLSDRCMAVEACYTSLNAQSFEDFCFQMEDLFSNDKPSIMLSTVHRAKGLEESRVFILYPEDLPLRWNGQKANEAKQEMNLKFVALTRSKSDLFFIPKPKKDREEF